MESTVQMTLHVTDEDGGATGRSVQFIEDTARSTEGVLSVERHKSDLDSMDIGSVVEIAFQSAATLALARGLAAWLRARRGAKVIIEWKEQGKSIKTMVEGIDPAAGERIVERHLNPGT